MGACSVIPLDEFEKDARYRKIVSEMHAMMDIPDHPLGRHCRMGHGRLRRAEIEGGKHLEYPWAVIHSGFEPGMRVLDAGCGRGILQYYLARRGCRMSCCDIDGFRSKKLLKIHRLLHKLRLAPPPDLTSRLRKNAQFFGVEIDYHIESMQNLSWPDKHFDIVYSISVLEHIKPPEEQRRAVQEMARVLKRGGQMLLTVDYAASTPEGACDAFLPDDIRRIIEWSGLIPMEPPAFDIEGWGGHLDRLGKTLSVLKCHYSAFTLVLAK